VAFLRASAAAFDAGFEAEAKRLAVVLRVLLHDTKTSASLLGQLGYKARLRFTDTAARLNPANLVSSSGLTYMKMEAGVGATWSAPLDDLSPAHEHPASPFGPWWTTPVLKDQFGEMWSRSDMVLALSNQDGGAHVDPALDERYHRLARENSMGWTNVTPVGEQPMNHSPVLTSVRQIAHEVIRTLEQAISGVADG